MYCRPNFDLVHEFDLPDVMCTIDLEVVIRYFLDDRDPTISEIIKEYPSLVEGIRSHRLYRDGYIVPDQKCFNAFNLIILPQKGVDLHRLTYHVLIDHILKNCVWYK